MTSERWPTVRLGDFVEVVHGFAFKTRYASDEPSPYALFTRKNFAVGGGYREDSPRYFHAGFEERFLLNPGDLMLVLTDLSKDGDLLGLPAIVPKTRSVRYLHNQRVGKVILRREDIDSGFLYALFRSPDYRQYVLSTASQTTVRDTAPSRIHDYTFKLPPHAVQMRIAHVLGLLDAKIESNQRLGDLLEEAAGAQFSARFMDFVGVDDLEETEHGRVPAGWTVMPFSEAIEINPRVRVAKGQVVPFIDMASLAPWTTRPTAIGERAYSGGARFAPGDVLLARITPCMEHGKGALVDFLDGPAAGSTEFLVLRARAPLTPEAVFLISRHPRVRAHAIASMSGSSGRQRVATACFDDLHIAVPSNDAQWVEHASVLKSAFAKSRTLWREQLLLKQVRDLLLPRLVSGRLDVSDNGSVVDQVLADSGAGALASP